MANPKVIDEQFKREHRNFFNQLDIDISMPEIGRAAILKWRLYPINRQLEFVEPFYNGNRGVDFKFGELPQGFIRQFLKEWLVLAFTLNTKDNGVFWQLILTSKESDILPTKEQERLARDAIAKWKHLSIEEKLKFINTDEPSLRASLLAGRLPQMFIVEFINDYLKKKSGSGGASNNLSPSKGTPPLPPTPVLSSSMN